MFRLHIVNLFLFLGLLPLAGFRHYSRSRCEPKKPWVRAIGSWSLWIESELLLVGRQLMKLLFDRPDALLLKRETFAHASLALRQRVLRAGEPGG